MTQSDEGAKARTPRAYARGSSACCTSARKRSESSVPQALSADPRLALKAAEQRAKRKQLLLRVGTNLLNDLDAQVANDEASGAREGGGSQSQRSPSSSRRPRSASPSFASSLPRFSPGPTEREPTSPTVGPGAYESGASALASSISEKTKTPRFAYGKSRPGEELKVTAAQMAYEVKGEQYLKEVEANPHGWLRSDYHRWLLAATNRSHYVHQREEAGLAQQQLEEDQRIYKEHATEVHKRVAVQRHQAALEKEELRERKAQDCEAMKHESTHRARVMQAQAQAWQEHAKQCVEETKQLTARAGHARSVIMRQRAEAASKMRAYQKECDALRREESEQQRDAARAAHEAAKITRSPVSIDWARTDIHSTAAFKALEPEQKKAIDTANAQAKWARERARERAKAANEKRKQQEAAKAPARTSKNLTQRVRDDVASKLAAQKEQARLHAEEAAAAAAAAVAAEKAEAEAAALAIQEAEQAVAAAAEDAAETARKNKARREKAAKQQEHAAKVAATIAAREAIAAGRRTVADNSQSETPTACHEP